MLCRRGLIARVVWPGMDTVTVRCFLVIALFQVSLGLQPRRFFATTVAGLETVLLQEIRSLPGVLNPKIEMGGVSFSGFPVVGYHTVIESRTALKVLEVIGQSGGLSCPDSLYEFARGCPWKELIGPDQTLKCDAVASPSVDRSLSHTHFTSLTVKNAICDELLKVRGSRPFIDKERADVNILTFLSADRCIIYRVWSGTSSLHKRGYRADSVQHKAALRETTAAGIVLLAGWNQSMSETHVFVDPMCGSGTIPIEAALIACDTAPGLIRERPTTLIDVGQGDWKDAYQYAQNRDSRSKTQTVEIFANDMSEGAVALAKQCALKAGVAHLVKWSVSDVSDFRVVSRTKKILGVTNPPWDMRLTENAEESWSKLGVWSKNTLPGCSIWTLSGEPKMPRHFGIKPSGFVALNAANVDSRLLCYNIDS